MKKKNRFWYILLLSFIVCVKRSEANWAFNKSSCFSDDIVDISEQEQEERINSAELDCFSQQINDETGKIIFIYLIVKWSLEKHEYLFTINFEPKFKSDLLKAHIKQRKKWKMELYFLAKVSFITYKSNF